MSNYPYVTLSLIVQRGFKSNTYVNVLNVVGDTVMLKFSGIKCGKSTEKRKDYRIRLDSITEFCFYPVLWQDKNVRYEEVDNE